METIRLRSGVTSGEVVTLRLSPATCSRGRLGGVRDVFAPSGKHPGVIPLIGKRRLREGRK